MVWHFQGCSFPCFCDQEAKYTTFWFHCLKKEDTMNGMTENNVIAEMNETYK
jgi:hypothetical protein